MRCKALAMIVLLALAPISAGEKQVHFTSNGDGANVGWPTPSYDGNGNGIGGTVQVWRTGNGKNQQTILIYGLRDLSTNESFVFGMGPIPNGDLRGDAGGTLKLNTDTSTNPDFEFWSGSGGIVSVEWKKVGQSYDFTAGTTKSCQEGMFMIHQSGTSINHMAIATGEVHSYMIPAGINGLLYKDHSVQVTIEKDCVSPWIWYP